MFDERRDLMKNACNRHLNHRRLKSFAETWVLNVDFHSARARFEHGGIPEPKASLCSHNCCTLATQAVPRALVAMAHVSGEWSLNRMSCRIYLPCTSFEIDQQF